MNCTRCHGLMLEEHMIDMEGGYGKRMGIWQDVGPKRALCQLWAPR